MTCRALVAALFAALLVVGEPTVAQSPAPTVHVFKSATCGCCANWVKHLQQNGFTTTVTEMADVTEIKDQQKVPNKARSCHTATVDGYVLEGHVPAADVQRLLKERPSILGLAVPGMPIGSPGMEVPNMAPKPYNVVSFDKEGQIQVFASH